MKSDYYWMKRSLANSAKTINYTEAKIKVLEREYKKALKTIQKQLEDFYKKYADETGLSIVEAKKALNKSELNLILKQYRELVEKINDPVAQALLNKFSKKQRITRLEALRLQIEKEVTKLYEQEEILTHNTLGEVYKNTYYRNIYEIQKGLGFGVSFSKLDTRAIETAINIAWSGASYSEIIWGKHRQQLARNVEQIITQGVILGESNDKMAIKLQRAMGSSFNNAKRLIRTESNYVHNRATIKSYEDMGQDEYKYLATLDLRTSKICASLDGKRFKLSEAQVGKNYPPMHPNCRSTTIPVVNYEDLEPETRLAKHDRKYYKVPANMTYQEWYKKYVNNINDPK
jgi:SPP1 gp7 family putative phage head morphogenesis protein